jgi:hypothetical protein
MIPDTSNGLPRPALPTLVDIRRRWAELHFSEVDHQREEPAPPAAPTPPPPSASSELKLGEAALYGVAGLAVRALAPHTEAHPAAILLQLLAAFANAAGSGPHCMVDATRHGLNLFAVLVGDSSKARKGTSWNQIRRLRSEVDRHWVTERVTTARLASAGTSVLFGTSTGDPTADRIWEAINASSDGLSRRQISALFHGHLSSDRIEEALEKLISLGAIQQREPAQRRSPLHPLVRHTRSAIHGRGSDS